MEIDPLFNHISFNDNLETITKFGFRFGKKGTHTSRTIMLKDISTLFQATNPSTSTGNYFHLIIDENVLGKQTVSSRKSTAQRMRELYGLDIKRPLFHIFRNLWEMDEKGRPLLALLMCLARDPILRLTSLAVIDLAPGVELSRQKMADILTEHLQHRLNASTIEKVVRNASSSWTQSGHLEGRVRKIRMSVSPTPVVTTFALFLSYVQGYRGDGLFESFWMKVLDQPKAILVELTRDAKKLGLLQMAQGGGVTSISFNQYLTEEERQLLHGTN